MCDSRGRSTPQGSGEISGKIVRLDRSLDGWKQTSISWHNYLLTRLRSLAFEQSPAERLCHAFDRSIELGSISIRVTIVHVGHTFAVGSKDTCDQLAKT